MVHTIMHNKPGIQTDTTNQQTPPSSYTPDISQRLMKKRALASQDGKSVQEPKEDSKDLTENIKHKHNNTP